MKQHPVDRLWPLFAPLSRATGPLRGGLVRRQLPRQQIAAHEQTLAGFRLNIYTHTVETASPPLLLVHGLGDNALTWALLFRRLSHHTFYAPDLPGYGFSAAPQGRSYASVAEMRDMLGELARSMPGGPPVLVGNSMGGWLGLELARAQPEAVRGLILLNPGGALLDGESSYNEFRTLLETQELASTRLVLRRMFGSVPRPLLYLSQSALQESFRRPVVRDFVAALSEADFLRSQALQDVRTPTALIWGEADAFLPDGSFAFFRDNLPNAALHVLPNVGHLPHAERPATVAALIDQFLAGLGTHPA